MKDIYLISDTARRCVDKNITPMWVLWNYYVEYATKGYEYDGGNF